MIGKEFENETLSLKMFDAMFKRFKKCPSEKTLLMYHDTWSGTYLTKTDYLFFEGMLFDKLLRETGNTTEPVCVIVGDAHAQSVSSLLGTIPGWECICAATLRVPNLLLHIVNDDGEEFEKSFIGAIQKTLEPLIVKINKKEQCTEKLKPYVENKILKKNKCAVCPDTENLKRCPCHKVRYCSVECQREDRPAHKAVCKKVKVKN